MRLILLLPLLLTGAYLSAQVQNSATSTEVRPNALGLSLYLQNQLQLFQLRTTATYFRQFTSKVAVGPVASLGFQRITPRLSNSFATSSLLYGVGAATRYNLYRHGSFQVLLRVASSAYVERAITENPNLRFEQQRLTRWHSVDISSGVIVAYDYRRFRALATLADVHIIHYLRLADLQPPQQQQPSLSDPFPAHTTVELSFLSASRLGLEYLF